MSSDEDDPQQGKEARVRLELFASKLKVGVPCMRSIDKDDDEGMHNLLTLPHTYSTTTTTTFLLFY